MYIRNIFGIVFFLGHPVYINNKLVAVFNNSGYRVFTNSDITSYYYVYHSCHILRHIQYIIPIECVILIYGLRPKH